jgi:hypothetical protein
MKLRQIQRHFTVGVLRQLGKWKQWKARAGTDEAKMCLTRERLLGIGME